MSWSTQVDAPTKYQTRRFNKTRVESVQQCPRELARVLGELQQLADQRWDGVGGDGLQDLTQLGEYLNLNRGTQTQRLNKRLN